MAVDTAITLEGTGSALNFGNQTAGTYTIEGKNADASVLMNGSAIIVELKSPGPPVGDALQSFCEASSPSIANLAAVGENVLWYSVSSGGSPLPASTLLVNGNHYYASQTVAGCISLARLDVTVTLNPTPPAPAGSGNQSFCTGDLPTVASLVAIGTDIKWYTASSGGTLLTPETLLVHNTRYYASQTVNGCESTLHAECQGCINCFAFSSHRFCHTNVLLRYFAGDR
jgi:large repetitive protein